MSKSANPVTVGVFVVCATLLTLIAIMVFGASRIFTRTEMAVCYFNESVNGLEIGAPVKYKGVKIGKVEDIRISARQRDMRNTRIEVLFSVDLDVIRRRVSVSSDASAPNKDKSQIIRQIEEGLRAQLDYQSIVTGMLYVELDFFAQPGDLYKLYGREGIHEIPVSASMISDIAKKLETVILEVSEIDFKGISQNLNSVLATANTKLNALDTKQINEKIVAVLDNVEKITADPNATKALENLNATLAEGKNFIKHTDETLGSLNAEITGTLGNLNKILNSLDNAMSPNSPFRYEISLMLKNLSDALISLKGLSDYIERNPNSIITGKPAQNK